VRTGVYCNVGRPAPGRVAERLWIDARERTSDQPPLVGDQALQQARLHPLTATARFAHTQDRKDAAHSGLTRRPRRRPHSDVDRTITIRLAFKCLHATRLRRDGAFMRRILRERTVLPPSADRRVNQQRVLSDSAS